MNNISATPHADHFLNRMALEYDCDPYKLHLPSALKDFFSLANLQQHLDRIDQFCIAAMHQKYGWKGGSPGNGLFYAERLELLIEMAYLLRIRRSDKRHKKIKLNKIGRVSAAEFPMYLTSMEYLQPFVFIESFFAYATLQKWKKMLNAFVAGALSNSSVADELPPEELLPFVCYVKKLVCAAYRISLHGKKDK